jgi:two-component system response regulator FixJ
MSSIPPTVIIVDDDAAVGSALKYAFEAEGFRGAVYARAEDLLAETSLPRDACLVIDYLMPEMDGIALLRALRQRQVDLPAILITTSVYIGLREHAAEAGFHTVLEKPLSDDSLLDTVRLVLGLA